MQRDVFGFEFSAIDAFVGIVIRPERRPVQGNSGKKTSRARVGEDFGPHCHVRRSLSCATLWTGGRGSIRSQLDLTAQNRTCSTSIHDEQNEISCLRAELKTMLDALEALPEDVRATVKMRVTKRKPKSRR